MGNVNDMGRWQCPFCTAWNDRFCPRCAVCNKPKVKYIPLNILLQQQQFQQNHENWYQGHDVNDHQGMSSASSLSLWTCNMCSYQNAPNAVICTMCKQGKKQQVSSFISL